MEFRALGIYQGMDLQLGVGFQYYHEALVNEAVEALHPADYSAMSIGDRCEHFQETLTENQRTRPQQYLINISFAIQLTRWGCGTHPSSLEERKGGYRDALVDEAGEALPMTIPKLTHGGCRTHPSTLEETWGKSAPRSAGR